jgi:hypothetical protein
MFSLLISPCPLGTTKGKPTSPVCDNSCSANLDGFVYDLSHPSCGHLYLRSPAGVAERERAFVVRLTGVGGEGDLVTSAVIDVEA